MAKGIRLLFISYWSAEEPLVRSTIVPYLRLMSRSNLVERVWLVTVERGGDPRVPGLEELPHVEHIGVPMRNKGRGLWAKAELFVRLVLVLRRLVKVHGIHVVDAKGALAGGLAHLVHKLTAVPYVVESFEPHSGYMADTGTWSRQGLYYRMATWLERMQRRSARYLVTVTRNYAAYLMGLGVPQDRVRIIPSITELEQFRYNAAARSKMRSALGWEHAVVGVYVGKFGGLYYDEEAFAIFKRASEVFGRDFRLVLLTSMPVEQVDRRLAAAGLEHGKVIVRYERHDRIPAWLSASDLAFSTIRYARHGLYQSPVKNGEYWANGLPILLCNGVGDDHRIIQERPYAGALFDLAVPGSVDRAVEHMKELVGQGVDRSAIMALAQEHRSVEIAERVYEEMFSALAREAGRGVGGSTP
ncbi:MAG: glycosyltransferase [Flavobacteriales bacterium]|nr:glycosyltransferase [Flavobacteriales bacterium]